MRRVVITGMGAITPIGNDTKTFWNALKNGECGIDTITKFDTEGMNTKIAAEVKNFDPTEYIDKKEAKRMDRFTQFAMAAAKMAIGEAGLDFDKLNKCKTGVIVGSGIGGIETFEQQCRNFIEKGPGRVSPFFIPMMISNMASGQIAIMTGATGVNYSVVSACATGTHAIGDALRYIRCGDLDVCITGGSEAAVTPLSIAGFCSMKAMSTRNDDPKGASCPFDARRDGFVLGEGAGILVLEELEHAKARGAHIIAELAGYGASDDAHHMTAPAPGGEGAAQAMRMAMEDAGVTPAEVGYINAHGTSTPYNDKFETLAIKTVLGDHAKKVPVSSTKSMTGHLLGATGAVEAIICALALKEGYIPQTINYKEPDPDCDLDYVTEGGRKQEIECALSNTFGFGGHNGTLCLKKYKE